MAEDIVYCVFFLLNWIYFNIFFIGLTFGLIFALSGFVAIVTGNENY